MNRFTIEHCTLDVGTLLPMALSMLQGQGALTKCCLCGADHHVGEGLFACLGSQQAGYEPNLHVHPVCGACSVDPTTVQDRMNSALAAKGEAFFVAGTFMQIPIDETARISVITLMQRAAMRTLMSAPGYTKTEPVVLRVLEIDRHRAGVAQDTVHYGLLYRGVNAARFVPFAWRETDGYMVRGRPAREAAVLMKALDNGTAEVDFIGRSMFCSATTRVANELARV
jgi:hypothetical protein